jgi:hypothetical protein
MTKNFWELAESAQAHSVLNLQLFSSEEFVDLKVRLFLSFEPISELMLSSEHHGYWKTDPLNSADH